LFLKNNLEKISGETCVLLTFKKYRNAYIVSGIRDIEVLSFY